MGWEERNVDGTAKATYTDGQIVRNLSSEGSTVTGRIMFEIGGVSEELAREAMRLAANKLPIKCKFVVKAEQDGDKQ